MAAQWRKEASAARGGNAKAISLHFAFEDAEDAFQAEPICGSTAEQSFEYQWALTVLDRVWARLRARYAARNQEGLADRLRPFITTNPSEEVLQQVASSSGKSLASLRVALHRLRSRYRETLHQEVAQTLDDPAEVNNELAELLTALRGRERTS